MDWKKNDVFQVKIEDMSDTGEGIGKTNGFIWFIKDAVIGDMVEAKVMKTKKSYGFARLLHVLAPSPYRTDPRCPVARQCGGCQFQAMDYRQQLEFKENKICNNLRRIGGLENLVMVDENGEPRGSSGSLCKESTEGGAVFVYPIIGMDEPWRYRNKAQFPFGMNKDGRIITGFYAGRTHAIIESEDCFLGVEENRLILECIRAYMEEYKIRPYNEESHSGLIRHVLIRKGFRTGELMVCMVINGEARQLKGAEALVERLRTLFEEKEYGVQTERAAVPHMASISCSINREKTNVIMGKDIVNLYGPGYIIDWIGNVQYRISPLSFYQVNPVQTEKLYRTALDQGIDDARANGALNGIENVEFFVGKAEEVLPEQYEKNQVYADVIVVDPPRKGCDEKCLETIVKMAPKRVVYVSCDSATLARDLKYLGERGYEVRKVRGCDMFPMSGHVETVCLLSN